MSSFEDELSVRVLDRMFREDSVRPIGRTSDDLNFDGSSRFLPSLWRFGFVDVKMVADLCEAFEMRMTSDRRRRSSIGIDDVREGEGRETIFVAVLEVSDKVPAYQTARTLAKLELDWRHELTFDEMLRDIEHDWTLDHRMDVLPRHSSCLQPRLLIRNPFVDLLEICSTSNADAFSFALLWRSEVSKSRAHLVPSRC